MLVLSVGGRWIATDCIMPSRGAMEVDALSVVHFDVDLYYLLYVLLSHSARLIIAYCAMIAQELLPIIQNIGMF